MEEEYKKIQAENNTTQREKLQLEYIVKLKKFQQDIKNICKKAWNQLNISLMLIGNINFVLCTALCLAFAIYLQVLSIHIDKSKLSSTNILQPSSILSLFLILFSLGGLMLLFDFQFGVSIGLILIPVQLYFLYFIGSDILYIIFLIKKKEENYLASFPIKLFNRRIICFFVYCGF